MSKVGVNTQIFINESSLQSQFQTIEAFEKSVREFISIFNVINGNVRLNIEIYKNEVFIEYEAIKNAPFQASLNQIKDRSLKTAFINLIFNKLNPVNWRSQRLHQTSDNYVVAETSQDVTDTSIAEIAERKLQHKEVAFLLVNFSDSNFKITHPDFSLCQLITIIKKDTVPKVDVDGLDNKAAFEQWVRDKVDFRDFLERNADKYNKTNFVVQGQVVYREVETDNFWYLDNLHKDHFEVFNKRGYHLGEANLKGVLDVSKNDKEKSFKI